MSAVGIDKYLNSIYEKIVANDDLCRLLYYDYDNPFIEPILADNKILYTDRQNQRLFFTPYMDDQNSNARTTLNIVITDFKLDNSARHFKDFDIEIVCMINHNVYMLNDGTGEIRLRSNAIFNEILKTFNNNRTAVGKDIFSYGTLVRSRNNNASGFKICFNTKELPLI
jgi:hypothetical protein